MTNIHILNEAFSTPIDREDIYRAITTLDEVVNGCKDAVSEMHARMIFVIRNCFIITQIRKTSDFFPRKFIARNRKSCTGK